MQYDMYMCSLAASRKLHVDNGISRLSELHGPYALRTSSSPLILSVRSGARSRAWAPRRSHLAIERKFDFVIGMHNVSTKQRRE